MGWSWSLRWMKPRSSKTTSGASAEEDYYRFTCSLNTDYNNGRLQVGLFVMYEPLGAWMTSASVTLLRGPWYTKLAQSAFLGNKTAAAGAFAPAIGSSELTLTIGYNF